jgi:hypothetical protein
LPAECEEACGSIAILVASPLEQAPNRDPQTIRKTAPQTPEKREDESMYNEVARKFFPRGEAILYLDCKCAGYGGETDPKDEEERDGKNLPQQRDSRLRK